ncbi:MAG TPA: YcnI family protein [Acidimicrobiia bacterium]|nr:YcnI family protein [Acidimicrobiia bacterium]
MTVRRALSTLLLAAAAVLLLPAAIASAHVTLQPPSVPKGSSDVIVGFAVPNESTTGAATTKIEIDFPITSPMLGVKAEAIAGWNAAVQTVKLPKPITTDDGQITEAVSQVTWATTGDGIGPDQYMVFNVLVGTVPSNAKQLVFKALQTYSDGTVVSWIDPIVKGTPAPDHPTPILKLTKKQPGS